VLPITPTTLIMPLVGTFDSARLRTVQERALHTIERTAARVLVLDITGVPVVDAEIAAGLVGVIRATRLLGAEVLLVGIRPEVAQTIVGLGLPLEGVRTAATLQDGLVGMLSGDDKTNTKRKT
jgi:rsbT co-antagonist protein RsbR